MREFHPCMRFIRKYEHSVRIYVVPLQSQTKQDIFMGKGKRLPLDEYTKIIIPSEQYKLASDTRILIPFTSRGKIGFANRDGSIVVEPQFSCYHGECYQKDDLVKVGIIESYGYPRCEGKVSAYHHTLYGLIDYQGKIILEPNYLVLISAIGNKNLFTVQDKNFRYRVINAWGKEIVPAGKYHYIDGFDHGFARVKIGKGGSYIKDNGNKWGIINEEGEEVLPAEHEAIWNFYKKGYNSIITENNGVRRKIPFCDLTQKQRNIRHIIDRSNQSIEIYGNSYGEYAGSYAQDVMGYSDDVINDAFDGAPDAYWNID